MKVLVNNKETELNGSTVADLVRNWRCRKKE